MKIQTDTRAWFCQQVEEHHVSLYRLARSLLKNEADAQDAVQDAVLTAYEKLGTLRSQEKFRPWIMRIVVNTAYDMLRQRRDTAQIEHATGLIAPDGRDPGELLSLRDALLQLSPELRAVIVLFYYEGLSVREISGVLGASQGAVKTRLCRARQQLRGLLTDEGESSNEGF